MPAQPGSRSPLRGSIVPRAGRSPRAASAAVASLAALALLLGAPALLADGSGGAAAAPRPVRVEDSGADGLRLTLAAVDTAWAAHDLGPGRPVLHELRLAGFANVHAPQRPVVPTWAGWIVVPPGTRPVARAVREEWAPVPARLLLVGPTPVLRGEPGAGEPVLSEELLLPGERPSGGARVAPAFAREAAPRAEGDAAAPAGGAEADRAAAPGAAARAGLAVGEPQAWRGRRIAAVTLAPLAVDGEGRAARLLRAGSWEIRFEALPGAERAGAGPARRGPAGRADARFGSLFLNPQGLRDWPAEGPAPASAEAGAAPGAAAGRAAVFGAPGRGGAPAAGQARRAALLGPELRLPVGQTRLYRVTAAALAARGYLPAGTGEDQVRLYQRRYNAADPAHYLEIETPILMFGEGDAFDGDDFFVFYGLRPRDDGAFTADLGAGPVSVPGCGDPHETNNSGNVYWLAFATPGGTPWARMATATLAAAGGTPAPGYRRVEYYEEDRAYQGTADSSEADRCHLNSWRDLQVNETIDLFSPDPAAVDGQVRAGLYGNSNLEFGDPARRVRVVVNNGASDLVVGTPDLRTVTETVIGTGQTVSGAFLAAAPTLAVRVTPDPVELGKNLYSYLDWVEVSYQALYRARDNGLLFHGGEAAGDRDLEIAGFTRADIDLIEVTDPRQPRRISLAPANLVADGPAWKLSLRVPQPDGSPRRFVALADLAGGGVAEYAYLRARLAAPASDPTAAAGEPDLIVVTHPRFASTLARWVDYRRSAAGGGYNVHVVSSDDVFDWFSGGLKDPWAIRRFCDYALAAWGSWALQLVGDANENVRGLRVTNGVLDLTPSRYHAQHAAQSPELLPADKWFATPGVTATYPTSCTVPAQMLVGRFPCNDEAELATMIDKTLAVEAAAPGQSWRRRGIFVADDEWSSSTFTVEPLSYRRFLEAGFQTSEDSLAARWDRFAGGAQEAVRFFLSTYLEPHVSPGAESRSTAEFQQYTATEATPALLAQLTQGALLVHYQGHANAKVLCHEELIEDVRGTSLTRQDVLGMNNAGKPWVFFGLGCHISQWAADQSDRAAQPSLGEKMLTHAGAAAAVYASPGYEYLTNNMDLAEAQSVAWLDAPPRPFDGAGEGRTRWVLGELMLAAEARILADPILRNLTTYREMVAQYGILGDALLQPDAGPPAVAAELADAGGAPVTDGMALAALDAGNRRQLSLAAIDEAGVDRVEVIGSDGADLSAAVTELPPPLPGSNQRALYQIELPVRAFDHAVTVHVYDTADRLPTDEHASFTVRLPQTGVFRLAGSPTPIDPETPYFHQDAPLDFTGEVATSAWVAEGAALSLTGVNLQLSGVQIQRLEPQRLALTFTAVAPDSQRVRRAVSLAIDGFATEYLLQSAASPTEEAYALGEVWAYPNPTPGPARIVAQTDAPSGTGRVVLYTVGGRRVAALPITPAHFSPLPEGTGTYPWAVSVDWYGRDAEGDRLANGVYLYRVELDAGGGVRSGMQRLVVMR